ncbi:MAG: MFS transporter [Rhodospirillaceae bacterium]
MTLPLRFSLFYASLFLVVGIQLPYWPVWLRGRGLSATEIGILVATQLWVKVAFNPVAGHIVDRTGRRRPVLFVLAAGSLAATALFPLMPGFPALLALSVVSGALFAAILPVGDNLTMTHVVREGLDYGRIRLWGSLAFIAASSAVGRLLDATSESIVVWLIVGGFVPLCGAVFALPDAPPPAAATVPARLSWIDLLSSPLYWTFLAATALTGASHAVYYGFATLHWSAAGIDHALIGALWGTAVAAEVILFAFSGRVVRALGPFRLILLGGLAGVARWMLLAFITEPWMLFPVQTLHAFTFGATHLGAMHFIARHIAPGLAGRAQGLYAAAGNGVVLGLATLAAGRLYAVAGGHAFLAMSVMAAGGSAAAFLLLRMARRTAA